MNAILSMDWLFLAAQGDEGWVQYIIPLLIFFFMIIGPILKKLTEGIRKKVADDRGVVEPREDNSKPPPRTAPEVALTMFDEIASMVERSRNAVKPKKAEPATGHSPERKASRKSLEPIKNQNQLP